MRKRRGPSISTQQPNMPSAGSTEGLPDARTAQRLLDVLALLEQSLRNGRRAATATAVQNDSRVADLQFENQRLRTTRKQAAQRLTTLLERLQSQLAAEEPAGNVQSFTPQQEHAA